MRERKRRVKRVREKKQKISLSTRLFLSISSMCVIFILLIIMIDSSLLNVFFYFRALWDMWAIGDEVEAFYGGAEADFFTSLRQLERDYSVDIEITDSQDKLVYSSDYDGVYPLEDGASLPESLRKKYELISSSGDMNIAGGSVRRVEFQRDNASDLQLEYVVSIVRLSDGKILHVYKAKNPLDEGSELAIQFVAYMAVGLLLLAIFIVRIFSVRFARPLTQISHTTEKMSKLDFSEKCAPSKIREVAVLSESINELSDALDVALDDLQKQNKKLEEDIEKEHTIENLRTSFITSISHEMKTPIAIIRGYAEGMKLTIDSDTETAQKYCDVIMLESERMNLMVMKLLEIIKYDSGDYKLNYERISVFELVDDWFSRESKILGEKGITYENQISRNFECKGDGMLLSSVVNNYLSNAVSHIDGERKLKAWAENLGGVYRISIFNTGANIADKDIDKIWTSFYRADKALSRSEGRFGLGLTIVASIQNLHGRKFGVENMPDGVRFWFDVEKWQEEQPPLA